MDNGLWGQILKYCGWNPFLKNFFRRLNDFITTNNPCGSESWNNLGNQNLCFRMKGDYLQTRERKFLFPQSSLPTTLWVSSCVELLAHVLWWRWEVPSFKDHILVAGGRECGKWVNHLRIFTQRKRTTWRYCKGGEGWSQDVWPPHKESILKTVEFYFIISLF